jgi:hypothetical protein
LILAIPLAIVEPLKLVALFVVGEGHFIAGVLVMICAYAGSLFITERLFVVLKPKLLILPWFAFAWQWFVTVRDKLRRTWMRVRKADPAFQLIIPERYRTAGSAEYGAMYRERVSPCAVLLGVS